MRRLLAVVSITLLGLVTACGDDAPAKPDAPPVVEDAGPDGGMTTVEEVQCPARPPVATGTCEVTQGSTAKILQGEVLTPTKLFHGGQVAVDPQGYITCVGCDCAEGGETVINCPDASISPGLINPHDHITYSQNKPYTDPGVRYDHRHQWRRGQDGKPEIPAPGSASADFVRWAELRMMMGGATSIVGSGGQPGLLRNLDSNNQEGLNQKPVEFDTFPLGDSGGTRRTMDCNYGSSQTTGAQIMQYDAYEPHTAEGVDLSARNEFLCQSSETYDTMTPGVSTNLVQNRTAMIHAVGLQPSDYGAMAAAGTALIWSPRSNITLYGETARVTTAANLGVEIALGTDWMPTGSMNLLRELACADSFNQKYLGGYFSDVDLWKMVTANAASVTATDDVIGLLSPGKVADIAIFRRSGKAPYRAVVEAKPEDVVLVMRGGKTLYGDEAAVTALATGACDTVDVCTVGKKVCLMGEVGKTYDALYNAVGGMNAYPAFACGVPMNEPTCTPKRPTATGGSTVFTGDVQSGVDSDGDGIMDAQDNCPMVFNPVRPVDMGMQGDVDGDGAGDACDPCPLDANTTTCTVVDPNDRDHDGVPNATDNCPDNANADQADADMDGKGDVCDACPTTANPGSAGCPVTIYAIKNGTVPVGAIVTVTNALVTGKGSNGFFVQVKMGDTGYMGPDHSGLFVFTGPSTPTLMAATVGARVTIAGKVAVFQGQTELDSVTTVTVTAAGPEALPAPVSATYAEVKTGGPKALTLESVIVELPAATVSARDTVNGEFTLVDGANNTLIVDDFVFLATPLPAVGQTYSTVRGILTLRQMMSKLEPRSAADLVTGPPGLASIGPSLSYARVGAPTHAPPFPTPLTVSLTAPAQGDTTVTVTSMTPAALTVTNVTIPNGQTSAPVPVTALAQNAAVLVTATLGAQTQMATVRVLGAAEAPTSVTLSPAMATVAPSGNVTFTVTLDVPAATATTVDLAVTPTTAGTVPATVSVPANQTSATFTYTDTSGTGTSTVTATLGASTSTAEVTVSMGAMHLVINEVDYDNVGLDTAEFVELYNPTPSAITLTGKSLLLVNGSNNTVYTTVPLTGTLAAGGYLVVGGANVTVPAGVTKISPTPAWTQDAVQNGAPDGVVLIDTTTNTVIDALSYEGAITSVNLPGIPGASLVEGTVLPATVLDSNTEPGSLCRSPNGTDTDNAATDWKFCTASSAGLTNP